MQDMDMSQDDLDEALVMTAATECLVKSEGNPRLAASCFAPKVQADRSLLYAWARVFMRDLAGPRLNDEAAGHIQPAQSGQGGYARPSSPDDGGDGHTKAASNGHGIGASPPSPNADGVGQARVANDGQGYHARPSATERGDEARLPSPTKPGHNLHASSSLPNRERGGQDGSAGNGHRTAASLAREPSAAHIAALGRAKLRLAETVMDTFKVMGRAIGDIRHREILAIIAEGVTGTEALRKIYQTAGANVDPDKRIREFSTPREVEAAIQAARKVARAA